MIKLYNEVYTEIIKKQVEFKMQTGREATKCYLGKEDMKELRYWVKDLGFVAKIRIRKIGSRRRSEINGLVCYVVDSDRHLQVA